MHTTRTLRRHDVQSTAVRSIGYDEHDWLLQVEFADGAVYNYFRVPPQEHTKLLRAESISTFMNRQIKPYYEYEEA